LLQVNAKRKVQEGRKEGNEVMFRRREMKEHHNTFIRIINVW
jgi:hypothetical protein